MAASDVVGKVRFYIQARERIKGDRNLSDAGKARAGGNLEQSISLYRAQAFQELEVAWLDVRRRAKEVDTLRLQAQKLEGDRWNYERLNFETRSAETRLSGFRELPEVTQYLEGALNSGNMEHVRAVCEVAPGVLRKKFPGLDGEHLVRSCERRLAQLVETPELQKVRQLESGVAQAVLQLVRDTEEVSGFYSDGFSFTGNEFTHLMDGVRVSEKVNPENLSGAFLVTTVEFEPAGAVS